MGCSAEKTRVPPGTSACCRGRRAGQCPVNNAAPASCRPDRSCWRAASGFADRRSGRQSHPRGSSPAPAPASAGRYQNRLSGWLPAAVPSGKTSRSRSRDPPPANRLSAATLPAGKATPVRLPAPSPSDRGSHSRQKTAGRHKYSGSYSSLELIRLFIFSKLII